MQETNDSLLNKLTQQYLNNLQTGEKDDCTGNYVFDEEGYYADGSGWGDVYSCSGKFTFISSQEFNKKLAILKKYIDKHGVDDKLFHDLCAGYENDSYPNVMFFRVADYVCETKNPKYIIKFLDFDYLGWVYDILAEGIINTNNSEYIKLFIKKLPFRYKHFCYDYDDKKTYKKLKNAYKEIVKSNKAGV